ncbi:MAG TPA: hypothetical protein VGR51_08685 [Thermoplasmata archaeon]|jgi:hypothetical protein|nr:hypothetical protein [Thermoplasmata archaeon]
MGDRLSKVFPVFVGVILPLLVIFTNAIWNYASIVLTIAALVWIGFAVVLLGPGQPAT